MCDRRTKRFKILMGILIAGFVIAIIVLISTVAVDHTRFVITIGHINDFKSYFSGVMPECAVNCQCTNSSPCVGGISRMWTAYEIMKNSKNFIFLNVGNNFMGTNLYYIFGWNITQYFLKKFVFDAYTIGITEATSKESDLAGFMSVLRHISPMVVCNLVASHESTVYGLYKKSIVIVRGSRKIGIIGVISSTLLAEESAEFDNISFTDAESCINEQAHRLVEEFNVFTIILISHCGFPRDTVLAETVGPKISVIVGGHSRTVLYSGIPPEEQIYPDGPYPTVVKQKNGDKVLVVSTEGMSKYFGNLTVILNGYGQPIDWNGVPIYMGESFKKDAEIESELDLWKKEMDNRIQTKVGETKVELSSENCTVNECSIGNLFADSMAYAWIKINKHITSVATGHSFKYDIPVGDIKLNDALNIHPYEDTVDVGILKGKHIKETLEFATLPFGKHRMNFLQVSGLKITYNLSNPLGQRVVKVQIKCQTCKEEKYEVLEDQKFYYLASTSYIMHGGGELTVISKFIKNKIRGKTDAQCLMDYIRKFTPLSTKKEGRIKIL